jgi:Bardet-Biedl syndrome 2 protein
MCLALTDVDEDNTNELMVGTDDFAIRFYKKENNIFEINENTKIILIHSINSSKFVYGLENGTVGLYDKGERVWKKKEKGILAGCVTMDINGDGLQEVICGWSTGKMQIRHEQTGEIIYEVDLDKEIAKLLLGDLNNSGIKQIICCTANGEIYGFIYHTENDKIVEKQTIVKDVKVEKDEIMKYDRLLLEKKHLMESIENLTISITNKIKQNNPKDQNSLDSKTHVKIDLQSNNDNVIYYNLEMCRSYYRGNIWNYYQMCRCCIRAAL